jgi:hypothetical protein
MSITDWYPTAEAVAYSSLAFAGVLHVIRRVVRRYNKKGKGRWPSVLYYSNGGPGPATRLLRVEAPPDGDYEAWLRARGASWQPHCGWVPNTFVQLDILGKGEFFMIDESQVGSVQNEMRANTRRNGGQVKA